jgi:serine/threonine protein kinase
MVIEWLTMSLEQLLHSRKKYAIKEFFTELVQAIEVFHGQDILHRDLKPSNVMLKCKGGPLAEPLEVSPETYELKVIDYGMSREMAWEGRDMTNQVGSLHYRAPELLFGETRYTNKVDIWALGCIFYFMQTGKALFRAHN